MKDQSWKLGLSWEDQDMGSCCMSPDPLRQLLQMNSLSLSLHLLPGWGQGVTNSTRERTELLRRDSSVNILEQKLEFDALM